MKIGQSIPGEHWTLRIMGMIQRNVHRTSGVNLGYRRELQIFGIDPNRP